MDSLPCSECGGSVPSSAKFCPDCGSAPTGGSTTQESSGPEITCFSCGERIPAAAKFCPECGGKPTGSSSTRPVVDDPSLPLCTACSKPISGRVVKTGAVTYHPDCFQCSQCAQPIEKDYVIRNTKPWCEKCVEWEKKEKKAGRTPGTRPVGHDERQSSGSSQSTPALRTDQVSCHECNKPITGAAVSYNGKYYHKACLTCKGCGQPLDPDSGFLTRGSALYHDACAKKLDGGGSGSKRVCAECGQDVGTKYLSDGGKIYHAACIVCSVCRKAVGSTGFSKGKNGEILCETHARESLPSTSSSTVPTGQVTSGIRFDHRTKTAYKVEGSSTLGAPTTTSAPTTSSLSTPSDAPGRRVSLGGGPAKVTCTGCFSPMLADAPKCSVCGKANARRAFGERRTSAATAPAPTPAPAAPKPTTAPRPSAPSARAPSVPTSTAPKAPTSPTPTPTPAPGPSSSLLCSECGSVLKPGAKFCGECGHRP